MTHRSCLTKALILTAVFGLSGCEKKTVQTEAPPPPEVLVTQVVKADVPIVREWVGTLDGSENADIRARVAGYLQKKDYQEGSYVKEGDLLFEIDPRPFESALDEAKSQLDQAQAVQLATQADFERSPGSLQQESDFGTGIRKQEAIEPGEHCESRSPPSCGGNSPA